VVSVVEAEASDAFVAAIKSEYKAQTGIDPEVYVCATADGAGELN
jgi:galactokinase